MRPSTLRLCALIVLIGLLDTNGQNRLGSGVKNLPETANLVPTRIRSQRVTQKQEKHRQHVLTMDSNGNGGKPLLMTGCDREDIWLQWSSPCCCAPACGSPSGWQARQRRPDYETVQARGTGIVNKTFVSTRETGCNFSFQARRCACKDQILRPKQNGGGSIGHTLQEALREIGISNYSVHLLSDPYRALLKHHTNELSVHMLSDQQPIVGGRLNPHPHLSKSHGVESMVKRFFALFAGLVYSFGGVLPFIPQYQRIRRNRSDRGFSTTVCLILLIANILRIEFWMLKRFSIALLLQSLSMITAQIALLELCIRVRNSNGKAKMTVGESLGIRETPRDKDNMVPIKLPRIWTNPTENFWAWTEFSDYVLFLLFFGSITSFLSWIFSWSNVYAEILGSTSVTVEAIILVPQLICNWERQSTEGLSYAMIFMWCGGDFLKLTYFTAAQVPIQFVLCAVVQCVIDVIIMLQIFTYSTTSNERKTVPAARRLSRMIRSGLSQRRKLGRSSKVIGSRINLSSTSNFGGVAKQGMLTASNNSDLSTDRSLLSMAIGSMDMATENQKTY